MLSFRRSFAMPEIGVKYTVHDFAHANFRVRAEHGRGITADEALMFPNVAWSGYGDRPRIDIILRGEARDVENGVTRWLQGGDFAIGRALDSLYMRMQGEEFLCLSVEWNLGSLGTSAPVGLPTGTLDAAAVEHLTTATLDLLSNREHETGSPIGIVSRIFARLRSVGVPFDSWRARDLVAPVPTALQRVADAVGKNLSNLAAKPGTANLEQDLGVSRRRVAELVSDLTARYGLNGTDWRTLRDRWRLLASLMAMSSPRARTEDVAKAVGYSSPNAFCHAYREARLPSPGNVRVELDKLR